MKRIVSFILSTVILVTSCLSIGVSAFADDAQKCGDNLTWSLSDDGVLTISGKGDMYDYDQFLKYDPDHMDPDDQYFKNAVFSPFIDIDFTKLVIKKGVTSVGDYAFSETNTESVSIPETVKSIGDSAFSFTPIKNIVIPDTVKSIGDYCFWNCFSLKTVVIGKGIKEIPDYAFSDCSSLEEVTFSKGVKDIDSSAFNFTRNLKNVYFTGSAKDWKKIDIDSSNEQLTKNAKIHYNSNGRYNGYSIYLSDSSLDYTGKAVVPKITVVNNSNAKVLKKGKDYTVNFKGDKKSIGKQSFTIKIKGRKSNSFTLSYSIKPCRTAVTDMSFADNSVTVNWKKPKFKVDGYEIQFARNTKFTNEKKVKVDKNNSNTSALFNDVVLNSNPINYFYARIRTYVVVKENGKNKKVYSSWSSTKRLVVKK